METPEAEVRRVAEALREAIRRTKTSQRQVERALGQGKGYLSQLLGGNLDLKLKHVFAVLGVLGVEPDSFFQDLYTRSAPGITGLATQVQEEIEDLKRRVARLESDAASVEQ